MNYACGVGGLSVPDLTWTASFIIARLSRWSPIEFGGTIATRHLYATLEMCIVPVQWNFHRGIDGSARKRQESGRE
jgi:hypothetical protein